MKKINLNKIYILLFLVSVLSLLIVYKVNKPASVGNLTDSINVDSKVVGNKLLIDYGNGEKSEYVSTKSNTPFDLLNEYSLNKNIPLDVKKYDFGSMVQSVNGKPNTNDLSWIYFVNGSSGNVAADKYELQPGDTVEWKYVKPEF